MATPDTWEAGIVKSALKDLRKSWGGGWEHVGEEIREALLARKVLSVVASQMVDGYTVDQKAAALDTLIRLATEAIRADLA